jgi:hypothetical protein
MRTDVPMFMVEGRVFKGCFGERNAGVGDSLVVTSWCGQHWWWWHMRTDAPMSLN